MIDGGHNCARGQDSEFCHDPVGFLCLHKAMVCKKTRVTMISVISQDLCAV